MGPRLVFSLREAASALKFTANVGLAKALRAAVSQLDILLIAKCWGSAVLGPYGLASRVVMLPVQEAGRPLMVMGLPAFAHIADDPQRLTSAVRRSILLLSYCILPALGAAVVLADPGIPFLLGSQWGGGSPLRPADGCAGDHDHHAADAVGCPRIGRQPARAHLGLCDDAGDPSGDRHRPPLRGRGGGLGDRLAGPS